MAIKSKANKKNINIKAETQRLEYLNALMEFQSYEIGNKEYLRIKKLRKLLHERGDWRAYCV